MTRRSEGSGCKCASPEEHARLVRRVDASFEKDAERVTLGLKVATSEALRIRAMIAEVYNPSAIIYRDQ